MKFSLMVNSGPYTHQASDSAYQFARAALLSGHKLHRVFFLSDGVNNASRLISPPQDDRNLSQNWRVLAEQFQLDLVVCQACANRRGILDKKISTRHGKDTDNMAKPFNISTAVQLIEAAVLSDRLIVFGK